MGENINMISYPISFILYFIQFFLSSFHSICVTSFPNLFLPALDLCAGVSWRAAPALAALLFVSQTLLWSVPVSDGCHRVTIWLNRSPGISLIIVSDLQGCVVWGGLGGTHKCQWLPWKYLAVYLPSVLLGWEWTSDKLRYNVTSWCQICSKLQYVWSRGNKTFVRLFIIIYSLKCHIDGCGIHLL